MIEVVNGTITIPNWEKHQSLDVAEKQREQSRVRMAKYRERQKSIAATETDVTQRYVTRYADVTQRYATEEDIEEDKKRSFDYFSFNIPLAIYSS